MSKVPFDLIKANFAQGYKAQTSMSDAIAAFVTCCALGRWEDAEAQRILAIGALDQWLDNVAAAHRIAEDQRED